MQATFNATRALIRGSLLSVAISAALAHAAGREPPTLPLPDASAPIAAGAPQRPTAPAVFNCADAGTGSLRAAVGAAVSGAAIDLTALTCSEISLTTGAIVVTVNDLSITGAGVYALGIENASDHAAYPEARVFLHQGSGTLSLAGMTIERGRSAGSGGCILSHGNVSLQSAELFACDAGDSSANPVAGGALFASGNISLRASQVYQSDAYGGGDARGGGVYAGGNLYARDSYLAVNYATSLSGRSFGGGAFIVGSADVERSAIFGNVSGQRGTDPLHGNVGGAVFLGTTRLVNSLVARNDANGVMGGLYASGPSITLHNSTIAFNTAATSIGANQAEYAAGVSLYYSALDLRSTIIANNSFGDGNLFDLNGFGSPVDGSHNLVMGSAIAPPDSLTVDPELGPVDFSGNLIVMPLTSASPAIDRGDNPDHLGSDQRGAGFLRVSGAAADIGAYEVQPGFVDRIFTNGFERAAVRPAAP